MLSSSGKIWLRSTFASRLWLIVSLEFRAEWNGIENTFCNHIPGIKRNAICLCNSRVESTLHIVDRLRDEVETKETVCVKVVEKP